MAGERFAVMLPVVCETLGALRDAAYKYVVMQAYQLQATMESNQFIMSMIMSLDNTNRKKNVFLIQRTREPDNASQLRNMENCTKILSVVIQKIEDRQTYREAGGPCFILLHIGGQFLLIAGAAWCAEVNSNR